MVAPCCKAGPGYATPAQAMESGAREALIYVPAIVPDGSRPDYIATVDVDPESETYSQARTRAAGAGARLASRAGFVRVQRRRAHGATAGSFSQEAGACAGDAHRCLGTSGTRRRASRRRAMLRYFDPAL